MTTSLPALATARIPAVRHRWPRSLAAGVGLLVVLIALALFAPWLTPFGPNDQDIPNALRGPSADHWLGTDHLGRDVLTRLLHAARIDLRVGLTAVIAPFTIGTMLGLVAGYKRGWIEVLIMRAADVVMAFPYYVLVIALVFAFGPGTKGIYLAVAAVVWSSYARIVHGDVVAASRADYVLAARAGGLSDLRVMVRHLLPNTMGQAIVYATSDVVVIILGVVTLSYLGLGVPAPTAEWGSMIFAGRPFMQTHPYLVIVPGLAVVVTGLVFSLIGDGLARVLRREDR